MVEIVFGGGVENNVKKIIIQKVKYSGKNINSFGPLIAPAML